MFGPDETILDIGKFYPNDPLRVTPEISTRNAVEEEMSRLKELRKYVDAELNKMEDAETDMICSAIYHHDDKLVTDGPMDEVLKDADVIDHCLKDPSKPVKEKEQVRYDKLCAEFGMRN